MDEELFELCKEVYKRFPDWVDTDRIYGKEAGKDWYITNFSYSFPKRQRIPLYTSDFLLEKLPKDIDSCTVGIVWDNRDDTWRGEYGNDEYYVVHADTPLKALLKLTISLHENGELK